MPIDASIPMGFRAAPQDVMGAYEQGQRISNNDVINQGNERVNELQKVSYRDQLMARAARFGAKSPSDWDRAFTEIAKDVPEAARYIGKWSPQAAEDLSSTVQAAGPQQRAGGIGGGGGGADSGGIDAAMIDRSKPGAPTGPGVDMGIMSPEKATEGYNKLTTGAMLLSRPGAITSGAEYRQALVSMEGMFPQIHQLVAQRDEAKVFDDPVMWAEDMRSVVAGWKASAEKLRPLATAVQSGLPVQEAKPGYRSDVTEAGIVTTTTPPGGEKPTYEFAPISGTPPPSFQTKPSGGGSGGGQDPDLHYDDSGKLEIDEDTRKRLGYAVSFFRKWQKMPSMGMGKSASRDRQIVLALASEGAGERGISGDIQDWADRRASTMSLGQMRKFADMTQSYEDLMLQNIKQLEARMPEGVAGAWPWLNEWVQTGRTSFGDPDVPAYTGALVTVLNEYAKILSGATGAAGITDGAREEAMAYLSRDMNADQVRNSLKLIRADAHNRRTTLDNKIAAIIKRIGSDGSQAPADDTEKETTPKTTGKPKPSWAP